MAKKQTKEEWIQKSILKHGNRKFDYSEFSYTTNKTKGTIKCLICGKKFHQTPECHIRTQDCPHCTKNKFKSTIKHFISRSIITHGTKYDYSITKYINRNTLVDILCKKHGVFSQYPCHHINGCGCPHCKDSHGENNIKMYLLENNIRFNKEQKFEGCLDITHLRFDFYLPDINTCVEYDGIQHFQPIKKFGGESEFQNVQRRDKIKNEYCLKNNIKLIRIKYSKRNVQENIRKCLDKELK